MPMDAPSLGMIITIPWWLVALIAGLLGALGMVLVTRSKGGKGRE